MISSVLQFSFPQLLSNGNADFLIDVCIAFVNVWFIWVQNHVSPKIAENLLVTC